MGFSSRIFLLCVKCVPKFTQKPNKIRQKFYIFGRSRYVFLYINPYYGVDEFIPLLYGNNGTTRPDRTNDNNLDEK